MNVEGLDHEADAGLVEQIAAHATTLTAGAVVISVEPDGRLTFAYSIRPDAPQDVLVRLACGLQTAMNVVAAMLAERGTVN
jgi:hypothetical protein